MNTITDATTPSPPPTRNPRLCQAWGIHAAAAKAAEKGEAVCLVRADGASSGLLVLPDGKLRREVLKPLGKAARKESKKLRRHLRRLDDAGHATAAKIIRARLRNLCLPSSPSR